MKNSFSSGFRNKGIFNQNCQFWWEIWDFELENFRFWNRMPLTETGFQNSENLIFWHFEPNFGFLVGLIRQTLTVRAKFSFSIQAPKKLKFFQEFFDWILIFRIILFFPSWTKWQEGKSLIFTDVDFFDILDEKLNYFRLFIWK